MTLTLHPIVVLGEEIHTPREDLIVSSILKKTGDRRIGQQENSRSSASSVMFEERQIRAAHFMRPYS